MTTRHFRTDENDGRNERLWPLDIMITALAGLILYLIVSRLRFDDPRWQFNAWTYTISIPLAAIVLAVLSHGLVTRYVQKSIQLGLLFSVFVHLLLLVLAINVIIFNRFFPNAVTGAKRERSPVHRTVPEYLFRTPKETATAPDWSRPVDVETASRIIPKESHRLPPVDRSAERLQLPQKEPELRQPSPTTLTKRSQLVESLPQPTDSPARQARRITPQGSSTMPSPRNPTAPEVPLEPSQPSSVVERAVTPSRRRTANTTILSTRKTADLPDLTDNTPMSAQATRKRQVELPRVGESGMTRQRQLPLQVQPVQPAGSSPSAQSVAVAVDRQTADYVLRPQPLPAQRHGRTTGAQLSAGQSTTPSPVEDRIAMASRRTPGVGLATLQGIPSVREGQAARPVGRSRLGNTGSGLQPVGTPEPVSGSVATSDALPTDEMSPVDSNLPSVARRPGRSTASPQLPSPAAPTVDLMLDDGPTGLAVNPGQTGLVPAQDQPTIGTFDLTRHRRMKRDVGGPMVPQGTTIAAVETFRRRMLRTEGTAAPAPAGMVGPATEEAIERGLAYLATIQRPDGGWSLQGHDENDVMLRSDTAATGLCLLAFQGAGYTHRQHQYASTVSRGLQYLKTHQRTNGDLYRPENALSNQNVALYSHGIAALALCEAYGMTHDEELRDAAQQALNYIIGTQHRTRGGWRYTPQVSSDTSVTGWMMMALKSGELAGLEVPEQTYRGIQKWLRLAQAPNRADRYRYNPFAPDTPSQRHGRIPTPTMTSVGMLMRMYTGWRRDTQAMRSAADYLLQYPPQIGNPQSPQRDTYYWYYATQVMFHMGGDHWDRWNAHLKPVLLDSQVQTGPLAGSWDPMKPVADRWGPHAGRLYVTAMNLLNLEVYYRHLPIYDETAD